MAVRVPAYIEVGPRSLSIRGVTRAPGYVLVPADLEAIKHIDAWLSKGLLKAVPNPNGAHLSTRAHIPTSVPPVAMTQLLAGTTDDFTAAAVAVGRMVTVTITGGDAPFVVDWDDTSEETLPGTVGVHEYAAGSFTPLVTADNGDTTRTAEFTVAAHTVALDVNVGLYATVTITPEDAIGPFTVDWGDGETSTWASGADPGHLYATADTFTITVSDSGVVPMEDTVEVTTVAPALSVTATLLEASGTATDLDVPLDVDWGDGEPAGTSADLTPGPYTYALAGTYTVTVTDGYGNTASDEITVAGA